MEIEFGTCAVNRPKLLDLTYSSLQKHLKGVNFDKSTLYIHIDKTPTINNIIEVEKVAKKYFKNTLIKYTDENQKPIYSKSFKWVIEQPKGEYFFYIEDDWKFVRDFHINDFLSIIKNNDNTNTISINTNWTHIGPGIPRWAFSVEKTKTDYKPKDNICTTPSFYKNSYIKIKTNY
jgi:hypothetical protein